MIISFDLNQAIKRLEEQVQSINEDTRIESEFDTKIKPNIGIKDYINRWYNFGNLSDQSMIIGLILLDRLLLCTNLILDMLNFHRLISVSYVLATKLHDDTHDDNTYYSSVTGIRKEELSYLERIYINYIDFDLYINPECFKKYLRELNKI